jgi:hypothetical protein
MNKDVECFNCHKKGHKKADCWGKGGGKEGQGPRTKEKKGRANDGKASGSKDGAGSKESANTVGEEEGVWMAYLEDSGDEGMGDTEFDDFEMTDEDLFYEDEASNELAIETDLATYLKKLLKIADSSQQAGYPQDNPNDLDDMLASTTDSSDDGGDAVAMQVESESESEVEIDPYWSKVTVDELQGLGNQVTMWDGNDSDIDSIPDLESVTGLSSSEDEDEDDFILANPDFDDLRSFVKGTRRSKVGKRDVVNCMMV